MSDSSDVKKRIIAESPATAGATRRTHRLKREIKGVQITVIPRETHGSVHLNPVYTTTLVKFIDAHDK